MEVARQMMKVKEVLDPAIAVAKNHDRLQLLRDDRLAKELNSVPYIR